MPFLFLFCFSSSAHAAQSTQMSKALHTVQAEVAGLGFTVVVEEPFVVVGDESPETVRRRAASTVRWAVHHLKKSYFPKNPKEVLTVWLFKDQQSYEKHTWKFWRNKPSTPFGYYSPGEGVLVMNIATGGGTLVHEIVHPFMAANFPNCPAWFNEGMGSLYEQSSERNGQIVGLLNWRLSGLQRTIRKGTLPSFQALMRTTDRQFYDHDPGSNYAQARYLLYYLQENGLLRRYYRAFHDNQASDPTGYRTLQKLLGVSDLKTFQQDWEAWVLRLKR